MTVRRQAIAGFSALFLVVVAGLTLAPSEPKFFRSSSEGKPDAPEIFGDLAPAEGLRLPAQARMAMPRQVMTPFYDGVSGYTLDWSSELADDNVVAPLPDPSVDSLQGEDRLELVAFATWHPEADDPLDRDGQWDRMLLFRKPETLEPFSPAQLDEMGVPLEFRCFSPLGKTYPNLRLLFRSNLPFPRFGEIDGVDRRTGTDVVHPRSRLNDPRPPLETQGEWVRADTAVSVWHDTPLRLAIPCNTGRPHYAKLERRFGSQAVVGGLLRVQWLDESEHDLWVTSSASEWCRDAEIIRTKVPKPVSLLRISDSRIGSQCAKISVDGAIHWPKIIEDERRLPFSLYPLNTQDKDALSLVLIPHRVNAEFDIEGLPDLPNPRSIANLFEVVIPRVTVSPEEQGHRVAFLAGDVAQCHIAGVMHKEARLPLDRTFRNCTAQQLLNWHLRSLPRTTATYDSEKRWVFIHRSPPSWTVRLQTWWRSRPDWLRP